MENPLLSHERIEFNEKDVVRLPDDSSSSFFRNILTYIKTLILSIFARSIELPEDEDDDTPNDQADITLDSDIEIIGIRITNDYHLLRLNRRNSFLVDDNNIKRVPQPPSVAPSGTPRPTTAPSSHQYGTDLSIAKPINYSPVAIDPIEYTTFDDAPNLLDLPPTPYQQSILDYYLPTKPISINSYSLIGNVISNFYMDRVSSVYQQSHDKLQELITKKRIDSTSLIRPLSPGQLSQVDQIWRTRAKVVNSNYQIDITTLDLQTLREPSWLNDNVIDYYFNLIMNAYPDVFGWTTHFYTALESKGYTGVQRWAKRKKVNLFEKSKVLVPVNISNTHWALAVIDNLEKTIAYYDSLNTVGNPRAVENLAAYMDGEAKRLSHEKVTYTLVPHVKSPQQKNGSDCGVFTCTAARYISGNKPLGYSQNDMKVIRRRMVYEILENKLLD
ncbi:Sentrin-specific protease 2 [Candida viswanathii]|uniref:Sentrin-specific protease 2 n=1 Tax=Candida viswanathii TaxID=5486 RepID=A0A367Y8U6_9ASCO|nr:Sentrin-specific protease 2 [Candida viswanathii]